MRLCREARDQPRPLYYMYYVYILRFSIDHSLYIGYTEDLQRRMKEHHNSFLLYYEVYRVKTFAMARERKLKQYGSAWRALKERILA